MSLFACYKPKPHSSVGSVVDLRIGGRWFDPRLGQYCFQGLMIVIATGFSPHSPLSIVSTMVMQEKQQVAWKEYCAEHWLIEPQESMDRCTGRCDINETLMKTALNTVQSINHSLSARHIRGSVICVLQDIYEAQSLASDKTYMRLNHLHVTRHMRLNPSRVILSRANYFMK